MASRKALKQIVVGLDGSPQSEAALSWAIDMAKGMGSKVTAVHAIEPPVTFPEPYVVALKSDVEWSESLKAQFEQKWCKALRDAGVQYRAVMQDGRAAPVISRVAEAEDADLIVVGRRGRGGVAEFILGSVSHELVLASRIPVLVVEPDKAKRRRRAHAA